MRHFHSSAPELEKMGIIGQLMLFVVDMAEHTGTYTPGWGII